MFFRQDESNSQIKSSREPVFWEMPYAKNFLQSFFFASSRLCVSLF